MQTEYQVSLPRLIPRSLCDSIVITNGKMVIPVGTWYQDLIVPIKTPERVITQKTIPVRFVPMRKKS